MIIAHREWTQTVKTLVFVRNQEQYHSKQQKKHMSLLTCRLPNNLTLFGMNLYSKTYTAAENLGYMFDMGKPFGKE